MRPSTSNSPTVGSSVTASGYSDGVLRSDHHMRASASGRSRCERHTRSHQVAFSRTASWSGSGAIAPGSPRPTARANRRPGRRRLCEHRDMTIERYGSDNPWEDTVGYCRAVRAGDHVHVAGTTATVDGRAVAVGDAAEQTRVALGIVAEALARAGASLADVVRTRMFVTDISQWEAIGRAHGEFFADVRPVATMVEVTALIDPDLLVEIEVDAYAPVGA